METIPYLAFQFITAEMLESIVDLTTITKAFMPYLLCHHGKRFVSAKNYLRYKMIDKVNIVTLCGTWHH